MKIMIKGIGDNFRFLVTKDKDMEQVFANFFSILFSSCNPIDGMMNKVLQCVQKKSNP